MTRRFFLQAGTLAAVSRSSARARGFRTISYNVLACQGFPKTTKNMLRWQAAQGQMEARVAEELSLYGPEILTFSESITETAAAKMGLLLGMTYAYFPPGVPSYRAYPIGFPGTLFTRGRILEFENAPYGDIPPQPELFTRHWGRAVIDLGGERVAVFSAHLNPHDAQIREREITVILAQIRAAMLGGRSVLFQGDLNHTPDGPEYQRWIQAGLIDSFAAKGTGGSYSYPSSAPKTRIDYIWTGGPLAERLHEARILNEGAFRTNPDDPASFALSDHLPITAVFGG